MVMAIARVPAVVRVSRSIESGAKRGVDLRLSAARRRHCDAVHIEPFKAQCFQARFIVGGLSVSGITVNAGQIGNTY